MKNHLKTLGIIIGGILAFAVSMGTMTATFGDDSVFSKICLICFLIFMFCAVYISIYKHLKDKDNDTNR